MNNKRRKEIKDIIYLANKSNTNFKDLYKVIEKILNEEQDAFDNMPENLQYSINGQCSENAICSLEEAIECIEEYNDLSLEDKKDMEIIEDTIEDIIDCLKDAIF